MNSMRLAVLSVFVLLIFAFSGCVEEEKGYPHQNYLFTTAETCKKCHDGIMTGGKDVSMFANWNQTMLSLSARDTYFLAKMESEKAKFPELKDEIEKECFKCHIPMAVTQARKDGVEISDADVSYRELAMDGVSCTLCHQIKPENFGKEESFSGRYLIDFDTEKPDRVVYGPYIPLWASVMQENSGYLPVRGVHVKKAELCAICHTLYTPTVSGGEIVGEFPEQTPFLEFLNSGYSGNKTCQDCHMPEAVSKISTKPAKLEERVMRIHEFAGGNVQMLKLLGKEGGAMNARDKLKEAVKVKIVSMVKENGRVKAVVRVENFAGHKFPTGFPSRRAFLHLVAYSGEKVVFESGKCVDGKIYGEDYPFERHHNVIDDENEVQIYESVMMNVDGNVTHTLLEGAGYVKDNRLLPKGFDKDGASRDVRVIGAAERDENFVGGSDEVTYYLPEETGKVRVELLYQPVSYPFLEELRRDYEKYDITEIGEFLKAYDGIDKTTLVAFDERVLKG